MTDRVVWMTCPYPDEICGEPATWLHTLVDPLTDAVEGVAICAAGHRWAIAKLPDEEASDD